MCWFFMGASEDMWGPVRIHHSPVMQTSDACLDHREGACSKVCSLALSILRWKETQWDTGIKRWGTLLQIQE